MAKELDSQGSIGARKSSDMLSRGETTHYDLRVAIAPSSSAVTDSLDFRGAIASLQIQFPSATHVRCARRRRRRIGAWILKKGSEGSEGSKGSEGGGIAWRR